MLFLYDLFAPLLLFGMAVPLLLGGVAAPLLLTACGGMDRTGGERVAAVSIPPQAWLVERIGGGRWQPLVLVSPGDSPATYQPSDIQISRVMQAEVYFRIGVPFEEGPWYDAITSRRGPEVVDLRAGIALRQMEGHHEHEHEGEAATGEYAGEAAGEVEQAEGEDPHIWLSPALLRVQAATVAAALERLDPDGATAYRENLIGVLAELEDTDVYIRQRLDGLQGRSFFIFHPSWGYFADAYGLRQIAVEIEGKEPTDADITSLKEMAEREGARVLFVQPQIGGSLVPILAEAIGARLQILDPLSPDLIGSLRRAADLFAEALR